jgi:hypothetical protein
MEFYRISSWLQNVQDLTFLKNLGRSRENWPVAVFYNYDEHLIFDWWFPRFELKALSIICFAYISSSSWRRISVTNLTAHSASDCSALTSDNITVDCVNDICGPY